MLKHKRLDKLEDYLTPRQAALLWLQNANKSSSFREYFKSLRGQPDVIRPFFSLALSVEELARRDMKGQPIGVVKERVDQALSDYCFLIKLHHQINLRLMAEECTWAAALATLQAELRVILWEMRFQDVVETMKVPGMPSVPTVIEDARQLQSAFTPLLRAMYTLREAAVFLAPAVVSAIAHPDLAKHDAQGGALA